MGGGYKWITPNMKQTWALSAVLINMIAQGCALAYTSAIMPALKADNPEITADFSQASLVASALGLGGIPGLLTFSFLMERYGRRIAHGLAIIPGTLGWLLIYFSTNVNMLIIGRLLNGVTAAASASLGAVVIGEFSSPNNRGMFLNLKTTSVSLGSLVMHILSNFCYWRTIALICAVPHVIAMIIIATWPETPAYLVASGQFDKAEKVFYWIRGINEHSTKELNQIIHAQRKRLKESKEMSFVESFKEFGKKFTKKDFLKPMFIIFLGVLLLEASGRHLFPAYAIDIMSEVAGSKNKSFYFILGLDIIILSSSVFSSIIVKMIRRRLLLFGSGFVSVAILAIVCTYLFLVSRDIISKDYPFIPVGLFIIYFILANLGCTPIPLSFLGELLPLPHKSIGSAIAGIFISIGVYLSLIVTPYLLLHCKVHGTFAVLGGCIAVILLVLYFILPETKDKTLQEIEDYFNYGHFKNDVVVGDDDEVKIKMLNSEGNESKSLK